ncbi:MAG: Ig-like domain-containing protein [Clostridia bacterium]|nr:Ig-like domain-containing protein [Clostridia bacterium]
MKTVKKVFCVPVIFGFLLSAITVYISALNIHTIREEFSDVIVSEDGRSQYVIKKDSGDVFYVGSLEKGVTVINIPEEIDGKKVVGTSEIYTDSVCAVKINYPHSVKTTEIKGLLVKKSKKTSVPLCSVNYNDEIEKFDITGKGSICFQDDFDCSSYTKLKLLVLPENLKELKKHSIDAGCVENVIVSENTSLEALSITKNGYDEYHDQEYLLSPCSIYFTGNALNANPLAFCHRNYYTDPMDYFYNPYFGKSSMITIYKKPDAAGFERFYGLEYKEALKKAQNEINEEWGYESDITNDNSEGYTVSEYTDEWWEDIKEIQSVEITGKGVTEKKNSKGKSTVTELRWSPSNDPVQYLSKEYELNMKPDESTTLQSSFAPSDAFDSRVFFVSLNEDVATIDMNSGEVKAIKSGEATIRCVAASGVYSDCVVKVIDTSNLSIIEKIKSNPVVAALCSGATAVVAFFAWLISHITGWFKK